MKKLFLRALFPVILTIPAIAAPASAEAGPKCDQGEFCAWTKENYAGAAKRHNLESANPNECVALEGLIAHSLVNRLTKDVTVYQSETCSTEAEFTTYPKGGTYVPVAPFVVRAIQIWA